MKPLELTMHAFGSYAKETTIDFTVPNQNLFLITGDTGAGKTTIFDAIVFALYGEASSQQNKKDGVELQSQYVDPSVVPYVAFRFSEQYGGKEEVYSIRRTAAYMKPQTRKGGLKRESGSLTLYMPDGTTYPQKEADAKLREIIGLTKEQFMQVAMIAQGEFMALLTQATSDKKEIFRKLFHTEIFENIVEELKRRTKEEQSKKEEVEKDCKREINRVQIVGEAGTELLELQQKIEAAKDFSVTDLEAFVEKLQTYHAQMQSEEKECYDALQEAEEEWGSLNQKLGSASSLRDRFQDLDDAVRVLDACAKEQDSIEEKRKLSVKIASALDIWNVYQWYENAQKCEAELQGNLSQWEKDLPGRKNALQVAEQELEIANAEKEKAQNAYTRIETKVKEARELFERIGQIESDLKKYEKTELGKKKELEQVQRDIAGFQKTVNAYQEEQRELQGVPLAYHQCETREETLHRLCTMIETLADLETDVSKKEKAAQKDSARYTEAKNLYLEIKQEYDGLYQTFLDAQAGMLAKEKLQPGMPCPVCGSLDHPAPCVLQAEMEDLSQEKLNEKKAAADTAQEKQAVASKKAGASQAEYKAKQEEWERQQKNLMAEMRKYDVAISEELSLAEAESKIQMWIENNCKHKTQLEEKKERLQTVNTFLEKVDTKKAQLEEKKDTAEKNWREANHDLRDANRELETLYSQKAYDTLADAEAVLTKAEKEKIEKETDASTKERARNQVKTDMESMVTRIADAKKHLPELQKNTKETEGAYQNILRKKQMEEEAWKQLLDRYQKTDMEDLQREVQQFDQDKRLAEEKKNTALAAIGEQERPQLEEIEMERDSAENRKITLQRQYQALHSMVESNARISAQLVENQESRTKVIQAYDQLDRLHKKLDGKESGRHMDMETFVQRYYLEQILYAANQRFLDMTAGQYELRMYAEEKAGVGNKNKGLDLLVYSYITGKEREIKTLSGGESFMAALALALGMSDQIQENAALIQLDMMFIDEGFGSLDDHARSQAVRVLQQMTGKTKLVGIISHVTELKQEIEDQLLVKKDDTGSYVKWQIS